MKTQSKKASMCAHSRDGKAWIEVESDTLAEAERLHPIYASAPQLLEALEMALSAHLGDWQKGSGWEKKARAAINAAKGEK